ncbi:prepilin-type N-terminal cleavage/methylation domain-containing protein [Psychrobacter sp. SMN/5/1215-MNA-CIBAN-0208]|uniref:GspH/FimT family pseudopilin n=1 Tax=Psychrobacter sp. SMN/5/1215-MNA-CIBAN-0208 TaxID=3140442 RepID=UPI00331A658D
MNASLYSSSCQRPATSAGFTLIELMVTITVLAIIVSIAAPSISNQLANQRVKSTASTIENALKEAKAESIIRRQVMTMTYSNNSTASGSITITDPSSNVIATYQYDAKSNIKHLPVSAPSTVVFRPNKTADERTYTICNSTMSISSRQIMVTAIATISNQLGGTCP